MTANWQTTPCNTTNALALPSTAPFSNCTNQQSASMCLIRWVIHYNACTAIGKFCPLLMVQIRRAEHGGHIPGAVNLTRKALRDAETGLLKPLPEQRQMFEAAGVDCSGNNTQQIFTYCNGGVASCSLMLALDRLGLGKQSRNYDGSWNEWGNDLQLPVETG